LFRAHLQRRKALYSSLQLAASASSAAYPLVATVERFKEPAGGTSDSLGLLLI
jgi:hypothetical protein